MGIVIEVVAVNFVCILLLCMCIGLWLRAGTLVVRFWVIFFCVQGRRLGLVSCPKFIVGLCPFRALGRTTSRTVHRVSRGE